jgi:hypothetical protein
VRRLVLAAVLMLILIPVVAAGALARPRPPVTGWLSFANGAARTGASSGALDPASVTSSWTRSIDGMDTVQPLVAQNVPSRGRATAYVATGDGRLLAYAPNGYVRWQRSLGTLPNPCPQLPEYGITGTPVIDPQTRAIYVADAFGLLHALDLATGTERPGWPVRLYDDPGAELVWGALADVAGSIYVGTGSFCDRPMEGKLIRVQIAGRRVSTFTVVPKALGGGGSIWGWGGVAYSRQQDALFAVTGNAFEGGTNVGSAFLGIGRLRRAPAGAQQGHAGDRVRSSGVGGRRRRSRFRGVTGSLHAAGLPRDGRGREQERPPLRLARGFDRRRSLRRPCAASGAGRAAPAHAAGV